MVLSSFLKFVIFLSVFFMCKRFFFDEKNEKSLSIRNYRYIFAPQKCDGEIAQLVRAHDS